ncbi:MAG: hypothetical protein U5O39_08880 [Gammaproteobacteria bacterium]|nr:hypothetical protein [Gammaproteobacteria bacterium]
MQYILKYFWQLCLLRSGPERLPATTFVLGFSFALYFIVALATNLLGRSDIGLFKAIAFIMIGVGVEAAILGALLGFKSAGYRFMQSMSALLGANSLILLLTLPISIALLSVESQTLRLFLDTAFLGIFIWWLTIAGFILHRAADISLALGIATAFGIEILVISTTYAAFPNQVAQAG